MTKNQERLLEVGVWPGIYVLGYLEAFITAEKYKTINNFLDSMSMGQELIFASLIFIIFEIVAFNQKFEEILDKHKELMGTIEQNNAKLRQNNEDINSIKEKFDLVNSLNKFPDYIKKLKHPYFISLINKRLNKILENKEIKAPESFVLDRTEITSPSAQETFGFEGIKTTKNNLRFISSFKDYWDDQEETEYDRTQYELINRGVKIRRIFVDHSVTVESDDLNNKKELKDQQFESLKKLMERQSNRGIEVRYIPATEIKTNFKDKDGLIQDDELLVDLKLTNDGKHKNAEELITMHAYPVERAITEFESFWNQAKEPKEAGSWRSSKCLC